MSQIELFDIQTALCHLNCIELNDFNLTEWFEIKLFDRLTVCKQMTYEKI